MATLQSGYQPKRSLDSNDTHARKKGEPPIHRGLQLSELEAPTPHFAALDKKDALKGGDSGPLELPAAPGLMTVVDLALYRSLEGELTPTICSAHARVAPCQKSKPKPSLLLLRLPTTRILIHSFRYVWMLPATQLKSY